MEKNHIYQYSLLNALMDGISESGITAAKLATKGNQGLGTFSNMQGELILLDGKVYRLAHGEVSEARPDDEIPFATSIQFVPTATVTVNLSSKDEVIQILNRYSPHTTNLFIAYRIEGQFHHIKCRTVAGVAGSGGPRLSDLSKTQFEDTYYNIEGTAVGIRSPENWSGFAVAGDHLHFIDRDRTVGGHVLGLECKDMKMSMAVASNVHIELPTSEEFNAAKLKTDEAGIRSAES